MLGAIAVLLSLSVGAQDLPRTQFKVIGLNSPTVASIVDEVPFWRDTLPKASKGALTADITPLDQMGIDDKTMLRLLRLGVMDFAASRAAISPALRSTPTRRAPVARPTVP
jgi:TRAP-type C4-dicarboxylate transport system substrate-binding protein